MNKYVVHSLDKSTEPPTPNVHKYVFAETEEKAIEESRSIVENIFPNLEMLYAELIEENSFPLPTPCNINLPPEILEQQRQQFLDSKPFTSWVESTSDIGASIWVSPVEYPKDDKLYVWDEETLSWIESPAIEE